MSIDLKELTADIADALVAIDRSGVPFRAFQPGVGPYGEPQLVKQIANDLNRRSRYAGVVKTKRTPDLLIAGHWALEIKIVRPFGDNGKAAENLSVNLLHPYAGNVSAIGDCLKLVSLQLPERRAAIAIGYEHEPAQIDLMTLVKSFEIVAREICGIQLTERIEVRRTGLVHPVHQCVRVFGWEVRPITQAEQ